MKSSSRTGAIAERGVRASCTAQRRRSATPAGMQSARQRGVPPHELTRVLTKGRFAPSPATRLPSGTSRLRGCLAVPVRRRITADKLRSYRRRAGVVRSLSSALPGAPPRSPRRVYIRAEDNAGVWEDGRHEILVTRFRASLCVLPRPSTLRRKRQPAPRSRVRTMDSESLIPLASEGGPVHRSRSIGCAPAVRDLGSRGNLLAACGAGPEAGTSPDAESGPIVCASPPSIPTSRHARRQRWRRGGRLRRAYRYEPRAALLSAPETWRVSAHVVGRRTSDEPLRTRPAVAGRSAIVW